MYGVVINNNKRLQFIIFCLSLSANIIFVILKYCDEMKRWLLVSALFFVAFCVQARGQKKPIKLHKDSIPWTVGLGSVDKVTEIRMNKGLIINPLNALNGQAAGVNISFEKCCRNSPIRVSRGVGRYCSDDEKGRRRAIPYRLRRQYRGRVGV